MSWWYICLLPRSSKNIITCQRKMKFHFCVTQKNNFVFFCNTNFLYSIFTFHIRSILIFLVVVLETNFQSIFYSPVWYAEVVTKSCSGKKVFLLSWNLSWLNLCKTSVKGSDVRIIAGFFLTTFAKINTVTGIFQGFYLDFKKFPIVIQYFQKSFQWQIPQILCFQ